MVSPPHHSQGDVVVEAKHRGWTPPPHPPQMRPQPLGNWPGGAAGHDRTVKSGQKEIEKGFILQNKMFKICNNLLISVVILLKHYY